MTRMFQMRLFSQKDRFLYPAVGFGFIYLVLGVSVMLGFETVLLIARYLPFFGALGGLYRYMRFQREPLILFHVIIDVVILMLLWYR
mgnify:CR=1 FL=1